MSSKPQCSQQDMFATAPAGGFIPVELELRKIAVPPNKSRKDKLRKTSRPIAPNCHIPSFKNSKMLITKDPKGNLLKEPFLITNPEFAQWMKSAVASLVSQLLSKCAIESGEILLGHSKLYAMLLSLPADDSVNYLKEINLKVETVAPGEEGATIQIRRLT
jgi:hypothetical protein